MKRIRKEKIKFNKKLFKSYNILGKIVYLFSIFSHINIELKDIYLK